MYELTEFLVDVLAVEDTEDTEASFPHRVTLHPTRHSVRTLHPATARTSASGSRRRVRRRA